MRFTPLESAYGYQRALAEWWQAGATWARGARRKELIEMAQYHQRIARCIEKRINKIRGWT